MLAVYHRMKTSILHILTRSPCIFPFRWSWDEANVKEKKKIHQLWRNGFSIVIFRPSRPMLTWTCSDITSLTTLEINERVKRKQKTTDIFTVAIRVCWKARWSFCAFTLKMKFFVRPLSKLFAALINYGDNGRETTCFDVIVEGTRPAKVKFVFFLRGFLLEILAELNF